MFWAMPLFEGSELQVVSSWTVNLMRAFHSIPDIGHDECINTLPTNTIREAR
jgi:hypothetical protein